MKKLIILLAAVCCLSSCISTSETDCIYQISAGYDQHSKSVFSPSESADLIAEYESAYSALIKKLSSEIDTKWVVTVKNGKYKGFDHEAEQSFKKYASQMKDFSDTWQKKFDACSDTKSSFVDKHHIVLSRFSDIGDKELARESFSVTFNK